MSGIRALHRDRMLQEDQKHGCTHSTVTISHLPLQQVAIFDSQVFVYQRRCRAAGREFEGEDSGLAQFAQ